MDVRCDTDLHGEERVPLVEQLKSCGREDHLRTGVNV